MNGQHVFDYPDHYRQDLRPITEKWLAAAFTEYQRQTGASNAALPHFRAGWFGSSSYLMEEMRDILDVLPSTT